MEMVVKEFIEAANAHNKRVDDYINNELKANYGKKITLEQWFRVNQLINEQRFYEKGKVIVRILRSYGVDAKMDCQTNKVVLPHQYCQPNHTARR